MTKQQNDRNAFAVTKKVNQSKCQLALPLAISFIFIPFRATDFDVSVLIKLTVRLDR